MRPEPKVPKASVSYSWDDNSHRKWVRDFAARLRADGVDVTLDQWHTAPGDQLPAFMACAIRENDFVLVIVTPRFKQRSEARTGGVGYEGDIMAAEVLTSRNHRKFIPILRCGEWADASPSSWVGKYYVDLRDDPYSKERYDDLLTTLHGTRKLPPALGQPPASPPPQPPPPEPGLDGPPHGGFIATGPRVVVEFIRRAGGDFARAQLENLSQDPGYIVEVDLTVGGSRYLWEGERIVKPGERIKRLIVPCVGPSGTPAPEGQPAFCVKTTDLDRSATVTTRGTVSGQPMG